MEYNEYYTEEEDIKISDNITEEAFIVAKSMYKTNWSWKRKVNCLTDIKFPIVEAFNIAETIKQRIIKSEDYSKTIKIEVNKLNHIMEYLYQRNIVLGILYYILSFTKNIDEKDLKYLEKKALYLGFLKNKRGMIFIEDFIKAVKNKKELMNSKTTLKDPPIEINKHKAQSIFNEIFREGLCMNKIDASLKIILNIKTKNNDFLFSKEKYWSIVYLWFREIKFIENIKTKKQFRQWAQYLYGKRGYSKESQFDEMKREYTEIPSKWKEFDVPDDYIEIRNNLARLFNIENRSEYRKNSKNIIWDIHNKTGITKI